MTTVHHVARAVASTGSTAPAYRVDVRVGTHELVVDEPAARGGRDVGPPPLGLLVSGLAACTATTLRMYAERKGWELASIDVEARFDVDDERQRAIKRTITVPPGLTPEQREGLADVAERTPVTLAIGGGTSITTNFNTRSTP